MRLNQILQDISNITFIGSQEAEITGVSAHSKEVKPGDLFIARRGEKHDASSYLHEAVAAGAAALITPHCDKTLSHIPQIIHNDPSVIEGQIAANFYGHPSDDLFMVGITGTSGKTTTSFMVKYLLNCCYGLTGVVGTVEIDTGKEKTKATLTTPDALTNQRLLRRMKENGCRACAMEVSSHALMQGRTKGVDFDVAIFTNLSEEHLDYHRTMEEYGRAKKRLFDGLGREESRKKNQKWAVVSADSPHTPFMLEDCLANVITYGTKEGSDLQATDVVLHSGYTDLTLRYAKKEMKVQLSSVGLFNVLNCLAAIATLLTQQIPLEAIVPHLSSLPQAPGRLQRVPNTLGLEIFVDYAHKPDALHNVLQTLKNTKKAHQKLIVVFGCGGERDRFKRPMMANICQQFADTTIVTSDNPRGEEPSDICKEIISGFSPFAVYSLELDRKKAIQKAIELAAAGDIVVVAGKGHETGQIFATHTLPFCDCDVIAEVCRQKGDG